MGLDFEECDRALLLMGGRSERNDFLFKILLIGDALAKLFDYALAGRVLGNLSSACGHFVKFS